MIRNQYIRRKNFESSEPLPFTSLLDLLTVSLLFYLFTTAVSLSKPPGENDPKYRRTVQFDLAIDKASGFSLEGFSGIPIHVSRTNKGVLKIFIGEKTFDLNSLIDYLEKKKPEEIMIIQQPDMKHQDTITLINAMAQTGIKSFAFGYRKGD